MIRVAVADDHLTVRKGIVAMLEADDEIKVVADAGNGKELIALIGSLKEPPDVCLLDVQMPVMNGYDTLVALRAKYPAMRFLVLSQLENEFIIVRMLRSGASGYMLKDTSPADLQQTVHAVMTNAFILNKNVDGTLIGMVRKDEKYNKTILSQREEEFLKLCCSELSYKEMANEMTIAARTVAFYRQSLFEKLGVKSRTGLALYALKLGLVVMDK